MKTLTGLFFALLLAAAVSPAPAEAEVKFQGRQICLNGTCYDKVWGRSSFKSANQLTYTFTGQGSGHWGRTSLDEWVAHHKAILGVPSNFFLRVFLETEGWSECESASAGNDGIPQNCMFGSEPVDKGFWNVEALRAGGRPTDVHHVGRGVLRRFFELSAEADIGFELVIIATLKHNDIDVGQQTHVVRQALSEMRDLQEEFPKANIIASLINEWNAHSQWTREQVNMLALRADRWKHPDGRTHIGFAAPAGFEPEQWPGGPIIVDGGGGNRFTYDVGPEPGKFRGGMVHPERNGPRILGVSSPEDNIYYPESGTVFSPQAVGDWFEFPSAAQCRPLLEDARGQAIGAPESMYYIEQEDRARAVAWYRPAGWTSNWQLYKGFLDHQLTSCLNYFVIHDEKGAQSQHDWPRMMTRVDTWIAENIGNGVIIKPPPPPPPPPTRRPYDHLIEALYQRVLKRAADPNGLADYNSWLVDCYADRTRVGCLPMVEEVLIRSDEYRSKFIEN